MAILYGTQSNGETLPVQVNETGQLVARGLQGEKGEKGDKGEQGEKGDQGDPGQDGGVQITTGLWVPEFTTADQESTLTARYRSQEGTFTQFGNWWVGRFHLATYGVTYDTPSAVVTITGFPPLVFTNRGDHASGILTEANSFLVTISSCLLEVNGSSLQPKKIDNPETGVSKKIVCSEMTLDDGSDTVVNRILGQVSGMIATPEQAAAQEAQFKALSESVMSTDIDQMRSKCD